MREFSSRPTRLLSTAVTQDVYMGREAVDPRLLLLSRKHLVTGRPAYRTSRLQSDGCPRQERCSRMGSGSC